MNKSFPKNQGGVNMDFNVVELQKWGDKRGFLVEFLRGTELAKRKLKTDFAQIYLCTYEPNAIRGNHYHTEKDEFITILTGKVKAVFEDINTKERKEMIIDSEAETLKRVYIGKNVAHVFKNISNTMVSLVAYTSKEYDRNNPDQYDYTIPI